MWRVEMIDKVTNAINEHRSECYNPATAEIAKLFYDLWEPLVWRDERMNTPKRIDVCCCHEYRDRNTFLPFMHTHSKDFKVLLSVDEGGLRFTIRTKNTEVLGIHFDQITNAKIEKFEYDCGDRHIQRYEIGFRYAGFVDYQLTLLVG